jgi:lysophospholipase L1-like esterase
VILAILANAAEPGWVRTLDLGETPGPPADTTCPTRAEIASPGVPKPESPTTSATHDLAAMVQVDTSNPQYPTGWADRLQAGQPFDVAAVPLEPLRGNARDIARVRAALHVTGRTVRVAFWGASHVAGEYFTGEVRRILQDRLGDAGHGFVMPAPPWTGYRGSDVNLCAGGTWVSDFDRRVGGREDGRFGVGGMSVEAIDAASFGWVQTTTTNPHGQRVARFEVEFLQQETGGTLLASLDEQPPVEIATHGPTGPGLAVLRVPDGPHRLRLSPKGDGPVRLLGTVMERETPGIVVDAMGVNGRTASSWQRWDAELMKAYLDRRRPDVAVLAYGTNEANDASLTDAAYRASLPSTLSRFRGLLPDTPCVLIGPSDRAKKRKRSTYAVWSRTEPVARIQAEIGPQYGCATWDLQAAMGGPGSILRWWQAEPTLAAGDLIHLSAAGYQEVARRFVAAVDGPK